MQQQFSDLLIQKQAGGNKDMDFLAKIVKDFPYCQPARMLYAKALMERKSALQEAQLNIASACAPDRRLFRSFLAEKQISTPLSETKARISGISHSAEAKQTAKKLAQSGSSENKKNRQKSIIESFLERNPRIQQRTEKQVADGDLAAGSIEDSAELVSETLAEILLKQGKKERAIMIYNKLSLMFPEKSSYFAKKLEHIQNENN